MKNNQNNTNQDSPWTAYWKKCDELTIKAEALVKERIKGTRKGLLNEPNYLHSFRVRDMVSSCHHWDDGDHDLFIAALLHDIVEDGGVTFEELKKMEFSDRTIELVRLCTHSMDIKDSTERWIRMIARLVEVKDEDAWRIKLADLTDNLAQSQGLSPENRRFMVEVKAPILLRVAYVTYSPYSRLKDEMDKQKAELEKQLEKSVSEKKNDGTLSHLKRDRKKPTQCHLWEKKELTDGDLDSAFDTVHTFSEDSHFSRRLIKCKQCGQLYLKEFYEEIDWVDGDDPQYLTYIPVESQKEAEIINKVDLWEFQSFFPKINHDWPKGEQKRIGWIGK